MQTGISACYCWLSASTGKEAISVSDNSFVDAMVINGAIRDEIGLNYGVGAMGPFAHANTTIGRAWSLIAINLGNCGKVGTTYMGVVGNPMNLINIVIAENEKESPWEPFSVRKGFKKNENIRQPIRRLGRSFRGKLEGCVLGQRDGLPQDHQGHLRSTGILVWGMRNPQSADSQFC